VKIATDCTFLVLEVSLILKALILTSPPPDHVSTDSEDESLVVVFPDAPVIIDHQRHHLNLQQCITSKNSDTILTELDNSSSSEFLQLAVTEVAKLIYFISRSLDHSHYFFFRYKSCRGLVSDEELLTRILLRDENSNPLAKPELLSSCVRFQRVDVLDRALPLLHQDRYPIGRQEPPAH